MQHYQPYDRIWNAQNELYDKWINYLTNVFKNMICCAICGLTKLNRCTHFKKKKSMYNNLNTNEFGCTPCGIANCLSSDYTTTSNGKEIYICLKCYIECDAPTYVEYIVLQSPTYMKALLFEHPFYIQLLSF
jgi:hypothetical protein